MSALHVSLIVTRDSRIISSELIRDETSFDVPLIALQYAQALREWRLARPTPDNIGSWQPPIREIPVDLASPQAAELDRILGGRDPELWPAEDQEWIASTAEHRPYDHKRKAA